MCEYSEETLSVLFDRGFKLHQELEQTTKDPLQIQGDVRKAILLLEDATRLVSLIDIFSRNEHFTEVKGEDIKYFLLPLLLGNLHNKIQLTSEHLLDERHEQVEIVEAYFRDFLQRCIDYEIVTNITLPPKDIQDQNCKTPSLAMEGGIRRAALKRYDEEKKLEATLDSIYKILDSKNTAKDEDTLRALYLTTLEKACIKCRHELENLQLEKKIFKTRRELGGNDCASVPSAKKSNKQKPLKPIIITRDEAQKAVFGLGYRNVPLMSIEEFYDQRVREGWFPDPNSNANKSKSLQAIAENSEAAIAQEELKQKIEEEKEEKDDHIELERKRNWDNWKDDHRRGEGNRHNMG